MANAASIRQEFDQPTVRNLLISKVILEENSIKYRQAITDVSMIFAKFPADIQSRANNSVQRQRIHDVREFGGRDTRCMRCNRTCHFNCTVAPTTSLCRSMDWKIGNTLYNIYTAINLLTLFEHRNYHSIFECTFCGHSSSDHEFVESERRTATETIFREVGASVQIPDDEYLRNIIPVNSFNERVEVTFQNYREAENNLRFQILRIFFAFKYCKNENRPLNDVIDAIRSLLQSREGDLRSYDSTAYYNIRNRLSNQTNVDLPLIDQVLGIILHDAVAAVDQ